MKHYAIDAQTLQAIADYIAQNPSSQPVGVAVNLLAKLQQLSELPAMATSSTPALERSDNGAHADG